MRRLLLFDVLANDFDGRTSAAASEVAGRPQRTVPQLFADAGVIFPSDHATGDAFQAVHKVGDSHLRRTVHLGSRPDGAARHAPRPLLARFCTKSPE